MSGDMWTVFVYELKRNITRRGFLFTTFGLPVIGFVILFGGQLLRGGSDGDQLQDLEFDIRGISQVGYVDYSGEFPEPGELAAEMTTRYETEEAATTALKNGEIDVYYIFPEDYLETGAVRFVLPNFSLAKVDGTPAAQLFYSQFVDQVDSETLQRLINPALIETIQVQPEGEDAVMDIAAQESRDQTVVQIFAILLFLSIMGTNGYLMQTVIEEKETRLIEILISSVRPVQLLAGKIFALGMLGLFQMLIYVFALQLAISFSSDGNSFLSNLDISFGMWVAAFVYFVLGYSLFAAAFGAIGAISTSISEGPSISVIFVLPALLPWMFAAVIADNPNGSFATIMSLVPITAPLGMLMRLSVTDVPAFEVLLSVVLLILAIVGMMWFAGRLFRVQILLSGKVPGFRDIPKLISG